MINTQSRNNNRVVSERVSHSLPCCSWNQTHSVAYLRSKWRTFAEKSDIGPRRWHLIDVEMKWKECPWQRRCEVALDIRRWNKVPACQGRLKPTNGNTDGCGHGWKSHRRSTLSLTLHMQPDIYVGNDVKYSASGRRAIVRSDQLSRSLLTLDSCTSSALVMNLRLARHQSTFLFISPLYWEADWSLIWTRGGWSQLSQSVARSFKYSTAKTSISFEQVSFYNGLAFLSAALVTWAVRRLGELFWMTPFFILLDTSNNSDDSIHENMKFLLKHSYIARSILRSSKCKNRKLYCKKH